MMGQKTHPNCNHRTLDVYRGAHDVPYAQPGRSTEHGFDDWVGLGKPRRRQDWQYITKFVTIKEKPSNASVKRGGPFDGERQYSLQFDRDRRGMSSASRKWMWEVTKEGMLYADQEWGPHNRSAQRV